MATRSGMSYSVPGETNVPSTASSTELHASVILIRTTRRSTRIQVRQAGDEATSPPTSTPSTSSRVPPAPNGDQSKSRRKTRSQVKNETTLDTEVKPDVHAGSSTSTSSGPRPNHKKGAKRVKKRVEGEAAVRETKDEDDISDKPSSAPFLPNEIVLRILSDLAGEQGTLSSFCQASRRFWELGTPVLWEHLRVAPRPGLAGETPTFKYGHMRRLGKSGGRDYQLTDNVKRLTVRPHPSDPSGSDCCSSHREFELPDLEVLHLVLDHTMSLHRLEDANLENRVEREAQLDSANDDMEFDVDDEHNPVGSRGERDDRPAPAFRCRFLQSLTPKTIVIHNASTIKIDLSLDLESDPLSGPLPMWGTVERLVFVSASHNSAGGLCDPAVHLTEMPALKEVVWIFDPTLPPLPSDLKPSPAQLVSLRGVVHSCGFAELRLRLPQEVPLTIVNVGSAGRHICEAETASWRLGEVKTQAERHIIRDLFRTFEYGYSSLPREKLAAKIEQARRMLRFINLDEFVEGWAWRGVFDEYEVKGWEKALGEYAW